MDLKCDLFFLCVRNLEGDIKQRWDRDKEMKNMAESKTRFDESMMSYLVQVDEERAFFRQGFVYFIFCYDGCMSIRQLQTQKHPLKHRLPYNFLNIKTHCIVFDDSTLTFEHVLWVCVCNNSYWFQVIGVNVEAGQQANIQDWHGCITDLVLKPVPKKKITVSYTIICKWGSITTKSETWSAGQSKKIRMDFQFWTNLWPKRNLFLTLVISQLVFELEEQRAPLPENNTNSVKLLQTFADALCEMPNIIQGHFVAAECYANENFEQPLTQHWSYCRPKTKCFKTTCMN